MLDRSHRSRGRLRWALAAVTLVTVSALLATGALASRGHRRPAHHSLQSVHLSAFTHPLRRARTAADEPAGGVLAAIFKNDGAENMVYVSREGSEYCLTVVHVGGFTSAGCAQPEVLNRKGGDLELKGAGTPLTVALLLPDGVDSATFTDTDGSEHTVDVENNVVARTDPNTESVRYLMPNGTPQSVHAEPSAE